jgi:hypothetical protein
MQRLGLNKNRPNISPEQMSPDDITGGHKRKICGLELIRRVDTKTNRYTVTATVTEELLLIM